MGFLERFKKIKKNQMSQKIGLLSKKRWAKNNIRFTWKRITKVMKNLRNPKI